jgi:hypothetical protein
MPGSVNLGDLPSWILVILIGLGISVAISNGMLVGYGRIARLMILGGVILGAVYFVIDLSNKL